MALDTSNTETEEEDCSRCKKRPKNKKTMRPQMVKFCYLFFYSDASILMSTLKLDKSKPFIKNRGGSEVSLHKYFDLLLFQKTNLL